MLKTIPHDDLEAVARQRQQAATEAEAATIVIRQDVAKAKTRIHKRMRLIMAPIILAYTLFAVWIYLTTKGQVWFALLVPPFLIAECVAIIYFTTRNLQKQEKPVVTLSREGITVHTMMQHVGLIRWEEIAEIRAYKFMYPFVGIVPKDPKILYRRAGFGASLMVRMNEWCIRWFYKPLRIFVAPINIPEEYIPMSAEALMARIAVYETSAKTDSAAPQNIEP